MSRIQMLMAAVLTIVFLSGCQGQSVEIASVSEKYDQPFSHLETVIIDNPIDKRNMVVSTMISNRGNSVEYSVIYYSTDDGDTWKQGINLDDETVAFPSGDPHLAADSKGNIYFSTLEDGITVWKSEDKGAFWKKLSNVPGSKYYDREWIIADIGDKTGRRMYASGKFTQQNKETSVSTEVMAISKSMDGGATFENPKTFQSASSNEALNSPMGMHLTKSGRLFTGYNLFYMNEIPDSIISMLRPGVGGEITGKIEVLVSEDNGVSFNKYFVSPIQTYGHSKRIKSMKCLSTGPMASYTNDNSETIYIAWIDAIMGFGQVVTSFSTDGGKIWSESSPVDALVTPSSDVSNSAIATNKNGDVLVVWNDRRNDPENICFQVMGAFSFDHGKSFSEPFIIDNQMTCPCGKDESGKAKEDCRWVNGGDTQGLISRPDGSFVLVFPSERNNKMELFLAKINP